MSIAISGALVPSLAGKAFVRVMAKRNDGRSGMRGRKREKWKVARVHHSSGGKGRGTGRTGAYGVDPSGATANVSVSVSAGRASGPADIIQEVTSRTCPIIPLPPIGSPRRPRRCAFTQGRRNALECTAAPRAYR